MILFHLICPPGLGWLTLGLTTGSTNCDNFNGLDVNAKITYKINTSTFKHRLCKFLQPSGENSTTSTTIRTNCSSCSVPHWFYSTKHFQSHFGDCVMLTWRVFLLSLPSAYLAYIPSSVLNQRLCLCRTHNGIFLYIHFFLFCNLYYIEIILSWVLRM